MRTLVTTRVALTSLGKITIVMMIGLGLLLTYLLVAILGQFQMPLPLLATLSLVVAAIVAANWRWAPALGSIWAVAMLLGRADHALYELLHPEQIHTFAFTVLFTAIALAAVFAGIGATLQNYGIGRSALPGWFVLLLVLLGGAVVGATLTAAIPRDAGVGVSADVLASLPPLRTQGLAFDQPELHAKVGEVVALRLENTDSYAHSWDLDEFGAHVAMPANGSALALFTPTAPGTYSFYCDVPGHREAGMVGQLIVHP